ncbi:MAG: hypothetical protein ABI175_08665, partial [Polyangiales bacterium]
APGGTSLAAPAPMRTTTPSPSHDPENHKLSDRDQRSPRDEDAGHDDDPGIETDPLPHHAHQEAELGDDEMEEAQLSSDDLLALDEDDLVYAEGPDA